MAVKLQHLLARSSASIKAESVAARPSPSKDGIGSARDLELELLALLSESEQELERLKSGKVARHPAAALEVLERLVNRMAEFSESLPSVSFSSTLAEILASSTEAFPRTSLVHVKDNRASLKTVILLYRDLAGGGAERQATFREIGRGLAFVAESFLALFEICYSSTERAERWRETYEVFLRELSGALDLVEF